jgi:hypothetical protein
MDINKLIPLMKYAKVRTPSTGEDKWRSLCGVVQEQQILSIAFRHDFEIGSRYALGCAVIHHYRDFCGGLMVESGMAELDMSSTHSYTGYRILGGRNTDDIESLPHINDLVETPPTTRDELKTLLEQSVAGAIVSQAMGEGRSMVHFMDKENGKLSSIMDHLKGADMLTDVPNACLAVGTGRLQPWRLDPRKPAPVHSYTPDLRNAEPLRATIQRPEDLTSSVPDGPVYSPVIPRIIEGCVEFKEIKVTWVETDSFRNLNSGNDVYGVIINLSRDVDENAEPVTAYCDECGDNFEYDGFSDCPECGMEIFDEEQSNRTTIGRPRRVVDAIRAAFSQPGAWKFVPHSLWRCG